MHPPSTGTQGRMPGQGGGDRFTPRAIGGSEVGEET